MQNENLSQILKEVKEGKSVKFLTKTNKNKNSNKVIEHSKSERLKLVNNLRAVKQDIVPIKEKHGESSEIKVVDFIKHAEDNSKPLIDEGISVDYVYDLYYANNEDKAIDIQDIDSVHGLDSDKFYSICGNMNEYDDDSSSCEYEDDSNDEGNWRNDYPDEDDMENSADEHDFLSLINQSKRWTLNNSSNSSCSDNRNTDDEDNIDDYDVRFARYRQRVKAEEHFFYNNVIDDSHSESSNSDD
ncbi:MATH and LRR domain-containing protein PFE0570w isoform X2 [Sipha flava]|uniref:MATH and LRR domain-containing protein PFE0570w isoform X2 n=1 Tax=Sipha flava TaxID=143950 RepID=A0A8B8FVH9_9HEMI|nr:MATH and LRR domain-containing protein PFE0570w isoform X2 [Sipha flava]